MNLDFMIRIKVGTFKQKASPILSMFVIACSIYIVGLLYVMQKTEEVVQRLNNLNDYSMYLQ